MFRRTVFRCCTVVTGGCSITTCPSGLRVISCDDCTAVTGLGVVSLQGPAWENSRERGAAAVLESLPLLGNRKQNHREISQALGVFGNVFKCTNLKECTGVYVHVPRFLVREGLEVLNGMVLHPLLDDVTLQRAKLLAEERSRVFMRSVDLFMFELTYQAAWGGRGMGAAVHPSAEELRALTAETITEYHARCVQPSRTVVVGTGVGDHAAFVGEVLRSLQFPTAPTEKSPMELPPYVGGEIRLSNDRAIETVKKFAERNLTYMALFLPGVSMKDPDYYTVSTLQTLLGGGAAFSSGGPGKGLHSKLHTEVLFAVPWIHSIEAITGWFASGGLVGLYGQAVHEHVERLLQTLQFQLVTMHQRVSQHQLDTAKNQLLSQLVMLSETRETQLSEMGKNLLLFDHVTTYEELMNGSQGVTLESLAAVTHRVMQGNPSFVVFGNDKAVPPFEDMCRRLQAQYRSAQRPSK